MVDAIKDTFTTLTGGKTSAQKRAEREARRASEAAAAREARAGEDRAEAEQRAALALRAPGRRGLLAFLDSGRGGLSG